jgi:hypothetical protein
MEEETLKIPHILDKIMNHIDEDDCINLLIVLKLEKVYLLHQLNIITHKSFIARWKFYTLLNYFLPLFTSSEISVFARGETIIFTMTFLPQNGHYTKINLFIRSHRL